jgi:glyoxylase-like metal-dependent hydrolase (beta-lactamase superfamily II)
MRPSSWGETPRDAASNAQVAPGVMAFGDFEVQRVVEWVGPIRTVSELFPDTPADVWTEHRDWLEPTFTDADGSYRAAIQTWVLRRRGLTVLVDTGVGNDRDRPQVPAFSGLQTDFLDRLATAGIDRAEVDVVVNTHIHYDHVGWNTVREGDVWVPTFPNARYLVPDRDREHFRPQNVERMRAPRTDDERRRFEGMRLVYADSITPVEEAGQLETWDGELSLADGLRLELTPGHTPGSSVLWLEDGDGAVFVRDLTHTPVQLLRPDDACAFDLDAGTARTSRHRVFTRAARTGATVLPAHYPGHGGAKVSSDAGTYAIGPWADFPHL